jgi:hypothetical protein
MKKRTNWAISQVLRINNLGVSTNLNLSGGGGGSLEVNNSRHETAYVKSSSVSLVFLQI